MSDVVPSKTELDVERWVVAAPEWLNPKWGGPDVAVVPAGAYEGLKRTIESLRRDLADPPADIQEAVLRKLNLWPPQAPLETNALRMTPIERDELIRWHEMCAGVSAQTDDFAGARRHRERLEELRAQIRQASCTHPVSQTVTTETRGVWKCRACGATLDDRAAQKTGEEHGN